MKQYAGSNAGLAGNGPLPAFASFNQLRDMGYMVNKGAKGVKIFCGFRESKKAKGEKVPCWGYVFDIVDTTAYQDKAYMAWLAKEVIDGRVAPSDLQVNQEVCAAVMNGIEGSKAVQDAYRVLDSGFKSKEVPMSEIMPADFLLPEYTAAKPTVKKIQVVFA